MHIMHRFYSFVIFVPFLILISLSLPTTGRWQTLDSGHAELIDKYVTPYVASNNFNGVILVASGDTVLIEKAYGMADRKDNVRNTPKTKFQIASISKSFTAAAILVLRDRGLLRLDDPVHRFIKNFPRGDSITIHQLLTHTSGLARNVFFPDYREQSQRHHTTTDLVEWLKDKPLAFPPGSRYGYSNSNFILLAHLVEKISGTTYGEFVAANILTPLGLNQTGHRGIMSQRIENIAKGWTPRGKKDLVPSDYFDYSFATGSGSLYSTAEDLLKWFNACSHGAFLNEDSRTLLFGGSNNPDGYGFHPGHELGRDVYYANGWDGVGFSVRLLHFRHENLTIIVLCNLNMNNVTTEILMTVSKLVLDQKPSFLRLRSPQEFPVDAAGSYTFGDDFFVPRAKMTILKVNGDLFVDDGRPGNNYGALLQTDEGDFIHRQHWFRVNFITEDGHVTSMKYDRFVATKDG